MTVTQKVLSHQAISINNQYRSSDIKSVIGRKPKPRFFFFGSAFQRIVFEYTMTRVQRNYFITLSVLAILLDFLSMGQADLRVFE